MNKTINCGVSCGVTECVYNNGGVNCLLDKIHVGNTASCNAESCTCCDSFAKRS